MKRICIYILLVSFVSAFFLPLSFSLAASATDEKNTTSIIPDLLGAEDDFDRSWEDESFAQQATVSDPLEPMNRVFFTFNDKLYDWVLKPVSEGYTWALPYELRSSFGNLFTNLGAPIRFVNALLQGDVQKSWVVFERFAINSTVGVLGMTDVAKLDFDLEPQRADFGQTLGRWGIGFGPYLYWPIFGPSSLRDTIGRGVDGCFHPIEYISQDWQTGAIFYSTRSVNTLSLNPTVYDDLRRLTFDPYVAARQAYYDYRVRMVEDAKDQ